MKLALLDEEEELNREINFSHTIVSKWNLAKLECDVLFIRRRENLRHFIKDIFVDDNFYLFETSDIRYIVVEDEELLELIVNNYDEVLDTKIEDAGINGERYKRLFRFFRIKDRKLFTIIKNFHNYFYIKDPDGQYTAIDGNKVSKTTNYFDTNTVNYEKDIMPMTRYAIEQVKRKRLKIGKNYRICNFDIETNASVDAVEAPAAILSLVAHDSLTDESSYWEIRELDEKKEKKMIEEFFVYLSKFDIVTGFNIIKFDLPYLINRAYKLGVKASLITGIDDCNPSCNFRGKDSPFPWFIVIPGINIVDLINLAEKSIGYLDIKLPDKKLDTLGKYILGEQKVETDTPAILFKNKEFDKLKEYNLQDVNIAVKLDKKLGLIEVLLATIELVPGLNLDSAVWNSKIIDFYLLSKFDIIMPSINKAREKNIKGAIVFDTVAGIHDNVAIYDVGGMYPSLIRTFNISPDTKDPNGDIKIGNYRFTSSKKGILVKLVDEFTELRSFYKQKKKEHEGSKDYKMWQLKEFTIKKILASTYGVFGFVGFRFFDNDIANAITHSGRELLIYMKEKAEEMNYEVLSGDTDGIAVKHRNNNPNFEELEKYINENIVNWMKSYTSNQEIINNHKIIIEYETLFYRIIFTTAKKKYMGLISMEKGMKLDKPKFYGKGNELIRKDTPAGMKEELRKIVMAILENKDKENLDIIKNKINEIKKSIVSQTKDDLIIYKEINRDFNSYKVMPQHVKSAINSNKYLGTTFSREDYKGGILYVTSENHPEVEVLFLNDSVNLNDNFKIDYNKYFSKFILDKIKLIFGEEIYKEVTNKNRKLSDFF